MEFEVGYGETSTVVFTDENDPYGIRGSFFNEEEFAICNYVNHNNDYATIFVNRDDVVYKHLFLDRLWYDGYYMGVTWLNGREQYSIFDLNGDGIKTSLSPHQGIYYDYNNDGFAEKLSWSAYGDGVLADVA